MRKILHNTPNTLLIILSLLIISVCTMIYSDGKLESIREEYKQVYEHIKSNGDLVLFEEVIEQETKYPWSKYYMRLKDTSWELSDRLYENKKILLVSLTEGDQLGTKMHHRYWSKLSDKTVYLVYPDDIMYETIYQLLYSNCLENLRGKMAASIIFSLFNSIIAIILLIVYVTEIVTKRKNKKQEWYQLTFDDYIGGTYE